MARTLEQLRGQVGTLINTENHAVRMTSTGSAALIEPINTPLVTQLNPAGQLPSFFENNPWVEVLSKRTRIEVGPVAG
jgi:hypothetical protein